MTYLELKTLTVNVQRKLTSDEVNLIVSMLEFASDNGFWDEHNPVEVAAWENLLDSRPA